jgi:hypothetical protein
MKLLGPSLPSTGKALEDPPLFTKSFYSRVFE